MEAIQDKVLRLLEQTQKRVCLMPDGGLPEALHPACKARRVGPNVAPAFQGSTRLDAELQRMRGEPSFVSKAAEFLALQVLHAGTSEQQAQVVGTIQGLHKAREFHRQRFSQCLVRSLEQLHPSLSVIWDLHASQVLPLEQYIEAIGATAPVKLDTLLQKYSDEARALFRGAGGSGLFQSVARELLAIIHVGLATAAGDPQLGCIGAWISRQQHAQRVARSFLSALACERLPSHGRPCDEEAFADMNEEALGARIRIYAICSELTASPQQSEESAGAAPASELLRTHFMQLVTLSQLAGSGDSQLIAEYSRKLVRAGIYSTSPPVVSEPIEGLRQQMVDQFVCHSLFSGESDTSE